MRTTGDSRRAVKPTTDWCRHFDRCTWNCSASRRIVLRCLQGIGLTMWLENNIVDDNGHSRGNHKDEFGFHCDLHGSSQELRGDEFGFTSRFGAFGWSWFWMHIVSHRRLRKEVSTRYQISSQQSFKHLQSSASNGAICNTNGQHPWRKWNRCQKEDCKTMITISKYGYSRYTKSRFGELFIRVEPSPRSRDSHKICRALARMWRNLPEAVHAYWLEIGQNNIQRPCRDRSPELSDCEQKRVNSVFTQMVNCNLH